MSFYIYYGKLDNELLVAVLPNGTVEHDDPIHLFLNKRFSTYRVKDISIDEDGEDSFAFNDGFYTYKAVSRKAHRELDLTIQGSGSKASKVALTRHYDQPLTAVPSSNSPKIWSGKFNFHEWAKNEPFIAIAPKGLGNGNPIISLWQWTQDAKGIANTLSTSVSPQRSDSTTPTTFSFEQNGYYTVNCRVNEKTKGLNVTVKAPTNPEVIQDEFALSAEVKTGAEHTFAPPRAPQQKFTLDCSLPRAAPSLTRFSGALPFPADLVATLEYSAAYVDQAGYLAKYAVRQFDQLDRSYHQLEKKSEARSARNLKLEVEIATLKEAEAVSKKQNAELQKLLDASRTASVAQDAELKKALATLAASEALARRYETHIAADKIADMKRDKEYQAHVNADHKAIDQLQCKLSDAQESGRRLQKDLDGKVKIIAARDASLALLGKQLADAKVDINKLKKELAIQCDARTALETEVEDLNYHLSRTREESEASKTKLAENGARIERLKADLQREETKFKACYDDLTATQKEARSDEAEHEKKVADLEVKLAKALAHEETHHILKSKTGITVTAKSVPSEC